MCVLTTSTDGARGIQLPIPVRQPVSRVARALVSPARHVASLSWQARATREIRDDSCHRDIPARGSRVVPGGDWRAARRPGLTPGFRLQAAYAELRSCPRC